VPAILLRIVDTFSLSDIDGKIYDCRWSAYGVWI